MPTILVPLDGSTFAEEALPLARRIARRSNGRLELVAVHEPALTARRGRSASSTERRFDTQLRQELGRYLSRVKAELLAAADATPVEARVIDGPVIGTLARHVVEAQPDLVVLTTHARGGPSRAWLGSVTEGLLRSTASPILAVRPCEISSSADGAAAVRCVLVALDGETSSERAIDDAIAVAGTADVEYVLLHVVAPLHPLLHAIATEQACENDLAEERIAAEAYLTGVAERLRGRGIRARAEVRVNANAAKSIVECAADVGADIIALATHARGAVGRALLGSVADKVLRTASTPVLLHRPQRTSTVAEPAESHLGETTEGTQSHGRAIAAATLPSVQMRRLLVATDFAEPSRRAAEWAARHLGRDAELVIVNAIAIPKPPRFLGRSLPSRDELCESAKREADARIRELSLAFGVDRVRSEVRFGNAAQEIVSAAADYAADVIVMADRGDPSAPVRSGTVQRVLRGTPTPVLLGRNLPGAPPRRILVAIDESPEAPYVLAWAQLLATHFGADLVALHAIDPHISRAVQLGARGADSQPSLDKLSRDATCWLDAQVSALGGPATKVTKTVAFGDPGPQILEIAKRAGCDMIVIGRGGAGRLLAMVVGSVTEHVLRIGDGPVLVATVPAARSAAP